MNREKTRRSELETIRRRGVLLELRYNENHDPETGRFTSKAGALKAPAKQSEESIQQKQLVKTKGRSVKNMYQSCAAPGVGSITYESGYDQRRHSDEVDMAQWLQTNLGGDVVLLKEEKKSGVKTPDYLWKGKLWDLKTISTEKAANSAIRYGLQQIAGNPGGIMLHLRKGGLSMDVLKNVIDKRMGWCRIESDVDILVISQGELLDVFRY